jgi:hypothetical protein
MALSKITSGDKAALKAKQAGTRTRKRDGFKTSNQKPELLRPKAHECGLSGSTIEKLFTIIKDKTLPPDVRCKTMYVFEEKTRVNEAIKLFQGILHDESENRHVRHAADWVIREMGRNGKKPKKV